MKNYLFNVFLAFDRLVNTLLAGSPQYSVSGRMGKDIAEGRCKVCSWICVVLSWIQTDHCARAYKHDQDSFGPPSDATDQGD